jgi:hypothetical protein
VPKSVWLVGGDGWAFDIGFGGLDHVLSMHHDVNVLVLDTEVYSNTGGQASKATPLGAAAKFASRGKAVDKKDLGLMALNYGHVFVASVAIGAQDAHTVRVLREAEAHPGPSLVIAYSPCIAHGYDLVFGADQQKRAVQSGVWPLFRYDPKVAERGEPPLVVDTPGGSVPVAEYMRNEARFRMVEKHRSRRVPSLRARRPAGGVAAHGDLPAHRPAALPGGGRGRGEAWHRAGAGRQGVEPWNSRRSTSGCGCRTRSWRGRRRVGHRRTRVCGSNDAGAAAIVLRSLFEEQIDQDALAHHQAETGTPTRTAKRAATCRWPTTACSARTSTWRTCAQVKRAVSIPVIASLNGYTQGGWIDYARTIDAAGADALELNLYAVATDPGESGDELETRALAIVQAVRKAVRMPVAVKLSPFYTSLANFALRLRQAGADALVLFNRFFEPDLDLEAARGATSMELSDSRELLLRLRWLALLSGQGDCGLAVSPAACTPCATRSRR